MYVCRYTDERTIAPVVTRTEAQEAWRHRGKETEAERQRGTHTHRGTDTHRDSDTQRHTRTEAHTHRDKETHE